MGAPYAGNAGNFPTEITLPSGSDPPSTTVFNTAWEGNIDRTAWLKAQVAAGAGMNFGPEQSATADAFSGLQYITAAAWDATLLKWIVAGYAGPNSFVWVGYGQDGNASAAWTQLGGAVLPESTSGCLSADPAIAGTYWYISARDDGTNNGVITLAKFNGSAWSMSTLNVGSTTTQIQKPRCILFAGQLLVAIGNDTGTTGSGVNPICYDVTSTLQTVSPGYPANDFLMVSNAGFGGPNNLCLIIPAFTGQTLTGGQYTTTTNGTSFSTQTMSFLTSTQQCVGLCWTGTYFLLAVFDTTTRKTTFMSSTDGAVWSTLATPTTAFEVADLAVLSAGLVVGTLIEGSSAGPSGQVLSPDAGITWYFNPPTLSSNVAETDAYWERARIVSSGQNFCTYNSLWLRFSQLMRLPTAHL